MCENKELNLPLLDRFIGDQPDLTKAAIEAMKYKNITLTICGDEIILEDIKEELEPGKYILTCWNTNAHITISPEGDEGGLTNYVKVDRIMGESLKEGIKYILIKPKY